MSNRPALTVEFDDIVEEIITDVSLASVNDDRFIKARALWDTGAVISHVSQSFAHRLKLVSHDTTTGTTADNVEIEQILLE